MSRRSATRHAHTRVPQVLSVAVTVAALGLGGVPAAQAGPLTNTKPDAPTELKVDGVDCAVGAARPFIRNATPAFSARVVDQDGGQNPFLNARFHWGPVGSGETGSAGVGSVPNGEIARVNAPPGTFVHGGKYAFSAEAGDGHESSDRSGPCEFEVDTVQPDRPPLVSSTDFPDDGQFHGGTSMTGAFTFKADNVADVKGFYYGYENPPANYVAADQLGGEATVNITARQVGFNTLYVQSVDRAGNVNAGRPVSYQFLVDQLRPSAGRWLLDGNGDDVVDNLHPMAASANGVTWIAGRDGEAAQLNRAQQSTLSTSDVGVRTDRSFSVAAWVRLDQKGDQAAAVSQDGDRRSGFVLEYSHSLDRWVFALPGADADGAAESRVASTVPAETGVWTRLIGVYDAASQEIKLYVNGVYQGVSRHETPWDASGQLVIGRAKHEDNPGGYWGGGVDDVVIYDRPLVAEDIAELSNRPAAVEAHWTFDEAAQQGPQTTLNAGATWVAGRSGEGRDALALDGDKGHLSTTALVRTDQSFSVAAWVKLDREGDRFTAVSQDGDHNSGFALRYSPATDKWAFDMPDTDTGQAPETSVTSEASAQTGEWTHLAGVYDHTAQQMRLYVNGTEAGSANKVSCWNAGGGFQIGRGKTGGYFPGTVEGVRAYAKALSSTEVTALVEGNAPTGAAFSLSSAGKLAADETGDHPATLLGGSSLGDGAMTGYATTSGPVVRTDQSFSVAARVVLARNDGDVPILAQTGGFSLRYSKDAGTVVFAMAGHAVVAVEQVAVGEAVHVAAVYDAAAGELRIFLNGEPQGAPVKHTSTGSAAGPVLIGHDESASRVQDARLHQGVLSPDEIALLAAAG